MLTSVKSSLVLQKIGDETLVYDGATEKAICLGPIGTVTIEHCMAGKTMQELVSALAAQGVPNAAEAAEEALAQLASEGLTTSGDSSVAFDRRKFLQAAGAAAALPVVASVLAPRPAQAVSCNNCIEIGGVAQDCNTCGDNCPEGVGCNGTAVCCYEYTLPNLIESGTCNPAERSGQYFCRNIPPTRIFNFDCAAARTAAVSRPGAATFDTYYCCNCPASAPFTCPTVVP